jgi:hypothetical protein
VTRQQGAEHEPDRADDLREVNLSPEISQQVVQFVFEQVKSRLPEGMGPQLEGLMAGEASSEAGGLLDKVKSMAAGFMGTK